MGQPIKDCFYRNKFQLILEVFLRDGINQPPCDSSSHAPLGSTATSWTTITFQKNLMSLKTKAKITSDAKHACFFFFYLVHETNYYSGEKKVNSNWWLLICWHLFVLIPMGKTFSSTRSSTLSIYSSKITWFFTGDIVFSPPMSTIWHKAWLSIFSDIIHDFANYFDPSWKHSFLFFICSGWQGRTFSTYILKPKWEASASLLPPNTVAPHPHNLSAFLPGQTAQLPHWDTGCAYCKGDKSRLPTCLIPWSPHFSPFCAHGSLPWGYKLCMFTILECHVFYAYTRNILFYLHIALLVVQHTILGGSQQEQ